MYGRGRRILAGETTGMAEVTDGGGDGGNCGAGNDNNTGNVAGFADGISAVEGSGADSRAMHRAAPETGHEMGGGAELVEGAAAAAGTGSIGVLEGASAAGMRAAA